MAVNVGHVNCNFNSNRITDRNKDEELICPYNFDHEVSVEDFLLHLARCRDAKEKKESMERCRFNVFHFYPNSPEDREKHERLCKFYIPAANVLLYENKKAVEVDEKPKVLLSWRERAGIENPRVPQKPLPDIKDALEENVRYTQLQTREMCIGTDHIKPDDSEFRVGGLDAHQFVREYGASDYVNYDQFTRRMSRSEKVRFAEFLVEEAARINALKLRQTETGVPDQTLAAVQKRRSKDFDMVQMITNRGKRRFNVI